MSATMRQPHEETWRVFEEPTPLATAYVIRAQVEEPSGLSGAWLPATSPEQARLASAAPDMARVLLDLETGDGGACCDCGHLPFVGIERRPHAPDCALDAALHKAGIR